MDRLFHVIAPNFAKSADGVNTLENNNRCSVLHYSGLRFYLVQEGSNGNEDL